MSYDSEQDKNQEQPRSPFADPTIRRDEESQKLSEPIVPEVVDEVEEQLSKSIVDEYIEPVVGEVINDSVDSGEYTAPEGTGEGHYSNRDDRNSQGKTSGVAIAAMVTGIIGIVFTCCSGMFGFPFGIAALITGIMGVKDCNANTALDGKGMAISGIVMGAITLIISIGTIIFLIMLSFGALDTFDSINGYY